MFQARCALDRIREGERASERVVRMCQAPEAQRSVQFSKQQDTALVVNGPTMRGHKSKAEREDTNLYTLPTEGPGRFSLVTTLPTKWVKNGSSNLCINGLKPGEDAPKFDALEG